MSPPDCVQLRDRRFFDHFQVECLEHFYGSRFPAAQIRRFNVGTQERTATPASHESLATGLTALRTGLHVPIDSRVGGERAVLSLRCAIRVDDVSALGTLGGIIE